MAHENRQEPSGIIEDLFQEGHRFNFFQAVYLLENMHKDSPPPGETGPLDREIIRFRPNPGLGFPATDICQIESACPEQSEGLPSNEVKGTDGGQETINMMLSFMGLYGVASPLPNFISELIARNEEETLPLKAFLDIFNHRLYSLFYRSWKKYRYYLQFEREGEDRFSQYMLSLIGLGTRSLSNLVGVPPTRLIAYSGTIGNRVHCPEGLRGLLSNYFAGIKRNTDLRSEDVKVSILEFIPRWVTIPEPIHLGSKGRKTQAQLSENVVIGKKILDCSSKFRVALGPLSLNDYRRFLPDGADALALCRLIRFYAPAQLDFDVELRLRKEEVPPLQLGSELAQLGRSSWLGKPRELSCLFYHLALSI